MSTRTKSKPAKQVSKATRNGKAPAKPAAKPKRQKVVEEQPVEEPDHSVTEKRYELQDFVATGKATIGTVLEKFGMGFGGMRTVARQVRYGRYQVAGFKPESSPAGGDSRPMAAKLAKLPAKTAIKQLVAPPRRNA